MRKKGMSRRRRRDQLERRRVAQARHREHTAKTVRTRDRGFDTIAAGPKPTEGYRKHRPYRFGEKLRRAQQIVSFCDRIGFEPTPEQVRILRTMFEEGKFNETALRRFAAQSERVANPPLVRHPDGTVEGKTVGEIRYEDDIKRIVDPDGYVKVGALGMQEIGMALEGIPTADQWEQLVGMAKRRKRGIRKYAESQGFELIEDGDPKSRLDWRRKL